MTSTQVNKTVMAKAIDWKAGVWAGLIAGAFFMMLEMLMVPLLGSGSPWGPPRMIAAIVMGEGVLPSLATLPTFNLKVLMAAMAVHFILSIIFAIIIGGVVARFDLVMALIVGAVAGLVLYLVNFYGLTAFFPWFAMARNWISIFAHISFGIAAAWSYKALAQAR